MRSITKEELKDKLSEGQDLQLLDVREQYEHDDFNLGGMLIPLGDIISRINEVPTDKEVVVYCHRGIRSQIAIQRLMEKYPFTNLTNLIGGTALWETE